MKRLIRLAAAVTAGVALGYLFTTPNGERLRSRVAELLRRWWSACECDGGAQTRKVEDPAGGRARATDPAVQAKIDETRRRLREQLKQTLAHAPNGGPDGHGAETRA